jgi:hypothetical protein
MTIQELRLMHARLSHQAEKLRQEQRGLPALSSRASALGRRVKDVQQRADDYAEILAALSSIETKELRKAS